MKRHGKYYFLHIRWVLRAERLFRYDQMFDWASDCSGFLVQNRLHPSILYRTDDYTSPAERTSVFVRQTVTWTSFSFLWKTRFGSFDQWTLFFFPPISFAHHADKSECLRLQFFLFWVSHVQHVHTDERQNLRSIFLLAASNSLNWVWPARKSFANTSF